MARDKRLLTGPEAQMWARAMADVVPLPGRVLPDPALLPPPTVRPRDQARPVMPRPREHAPMPRAPHPVQAGHVHLHGVDGALADRLRRGLLPIEGRIDLHGRTVDVAWRDLDRFLVHAHEAGHRCVIIITGKGLRGADPSRTGQIRAALPQWLAQPHLKGKIIAWSPAQAHHGGDGAFYVLLKRRRTR
ncbi:Smr/MutS family protein [Zavarzinia sp. CC-PAN008]|uniref:Smr/MutS family protein n=1 Tax=Zavarzinia sp. CC-PAN008 TaxID=3243332 RepID=UPI003F743454